MALSAEQLSRDLVIPDLVSALQAAWNHERASCAVRWCRGPRIVPIADNYYRLGYDPPMSLGQSATPGTSTRSACCAITTAIVPSALRHLAAERHRPVDVLLARPGISYRRDAIDWQNTGTPQQLDRWRISKRELAGPDLDEMIVRAA
ncbi:MAG TPA: hypothetical protein VLM11_23050 [Streptosporangiaceae bacterium]|nr:hypothetical protein [Streptosporangiaceae bacterium]